MIVCVFVCFQWCYVLTRMQWPKKDKTISVTTSFVSSISNATLPQCEILSYIVVSYTSRVEYYVFLLNKPIQPPKLWTLIFELWPSYLCSLMFCFIVFKSLVIGNKLVN